MSVDDVMRWWNGQVMSRREAAVRRALLDYPLSLLTLVDRATNGSAARGTMARHELWLDIDGPDARMLWWLEVRVGEAGEYVLIVHESVAAT